MRYSKSDVVLGGMSPLPYDTYTVRLLEVSKDVTKSSNKPCIKAKWEIVAPQVVQVGGQNFACAGRTFYTMPNVLDPSVPWGVGAIQQALERAGFDMTRFNAEGEFDDEMLGELNGLTCQMTLKTEESFKTRPPSNEEIAGGMAPNARVELTDGNGDRISNGHYIQARWSDIVGPAPEGVAF